MVKISVIVPVYNMERYLSQTLESLKNQKLKDIEVIVVEDGSTDSTVSIIDRFVKENSNFKKIILQRKGLAFSRNAGLEVAAGKYVTFLDGDDLYTKNFLSNMYDIAEKHSADMAVGRMKSFDSFGKHSFSSTTELARRKLTEKFDTDLIWNPSLSNKLFLRSKVKEMGLKVQDCSVAQEALFSMSYALKSDVIACSHKSFALYRTRGLDKDLNSNVSHLNDYINGYEQIRKVAQESFAKTIESAVTDFDKGELIKKRDDYLEQIYLKELTVILYRYYRRFWLLDESFVEPICKAVESINEKLTVQSKKNITRWNRDIFKKDKLVMKREEMAQNPLVCICVCGELTKQQLKTQMDYLYRQSLPSFELLVSSEFRDIFPKEFKRFENVRFIKAKTQAEFKNVSLESANAKYIMFLDRFTVIDLKGILQLYKAISKNNDTDFITSPISRYHNDCVEEYKFSTLSFSVSKNATRSVDSSELILDLFLSNKLFKISHINGIKFSFSDNSVLDMYKLYVNSRFKKVFSRGIYFGEREDRLLAEIAEVKGLIPPDYSTYLKKWKLHYKKNVSENEWLTKLIIFLKRVKKMLIYSYDMFLKATLGRLPLRNRVLFYTIRSNGDLLENSKCVYDKLDAKKTVFAHALPHSIFLKPIIYYKLFTSKVIVTDDYLKYLRLFKLQKTQKVIQIWHAGGAFKRFGLDAPSNLTRIEEMKTHSQYDTVAVSSEYCRQFYAHAFGIDFNVVKPLGVPRTDILLNPDKCEKMREKFFNTHPKLKDKKIIVYFPTFREEAGQKCTFNPQIDWSKLDESLNENEVFIIHKHPIMQEDFLKGRFFKNIKDYTYESTPTLLCVADVIITDYSSVIFDAALLNLPTVFYCPDFDSYERDFYLKYPEDLPGPVIYNYDEIVQAVRDTIKNPPTQMIERFRDNQVGACDGNSTKRVVELIEKYLKE
ncbi:MAG TPA: CDP-glycerol glycerophosphotransferase family protein [Clostridia bacterium]|nr:CDP-glycerol glycerophosphotransferase family protein [Clostridia bacterium]